MFIPQVKICGNANIVTKSIYGKVLFIKMFKCKISYNFLHKFTSRKHMVIEVNKIIKFSVTLLVLVFR